MWYFFMFVIIVEKVGCDCGIVEKVGYVCGIVEKVGYVCGIVEKWWNNII